jgi:hypothetical protein
VESLEDKPKITLDKKILNIITGMWLWEHLCRLYHRMFSSGEQTANPDVETGKNA